MILHTINKPAALRLCEKLIRADDQVILIEEGVYLANTDMPGEVSVICTDAMARGWDVGDVKQIDYAEFVSLTVQAEKVCNWF
ncbi:MAG: hypothetical protein JJ934_03145 [Pseudomonadales bacterium]|nr:hypothetical protein [Pseudomonadales bacterium]MBO6655859.1 hypothetical protein [Pseudomonadales bacterium]MBO6701754.1 hypothetical protein [Pseudomonadales bacterium]MBO7007279.1 hypothetical protein [Pseudomonadales bacterium]